MLHHLMHQRGRTYRFKRRIRWRSHFGCRRSEKEGEREKKDDCLGQLDTLRRLVVLVDVLFVWVGVEYLASYECGYD